MLFNPIELETAKIVTETALTWKSDDATITLFEIKLIWIFLTQKLLQSSTCSSSSFAGNVK